MDPIEEIKQKLDVVTVVGEYVELKKSGMNYRGRCPFHNEKTPSFFVSPDRQIFHCFGCSEGGDIFTFIQKIEGLEFPEALKLLADKAGVKLEKTDKRAYSIKNKLLEVLEKTANYWQQNLETETGKIGLDYLKNRGISDESIAEFKLGYAKDEWTDIYDFLRSNNFAENEIFGAGLTIKRQEKSGYYDRFRHRVTFPIQDLHGNVIGFTARALNADDTAKYINTPETAVYHKSNILYGIDKAKKHIRQQDYVIVVEGNMDVIACHGAGYKNVVACSGTALTKEQVALLKRFSDNVALCFDSDDAGQNAIKRSVDILNEHEMNTKIIELISGKDPDECIKISLRDWINSIKQAKSAMQYYIDKSFTSDVLLDINKKKKASNFILTEVAKLKNKIEQDHWLKKVALILDVPEQAIRESIPTLKSTGQSNINQVKTEKSVINNKIPAHNENYTRLLTILINYPEMMSFAIEKLNPEMLGDEQIASFYKNLIIYYNDDNNLTYEKLIKKINDNSQVIEESYLNSLVIYIEKLYENFSLDDLQKELFDLIISIKKNFHDNQVKENNKLLTQLENTNADIEKINEIIKKIQYHSQELAQLK